MADKNIIENHILNIIQKEEVREQSDLQELLKSRGFDIPQATLSRRLKKLNIAKIGGIYKIIDFFHIFIFFLTNFALGGDNVSVS